MSYLWQTCTICGKYLCVCVGVTLPVGNQAEEKQEEPKNSCTHQWVNVGFQFTKLVCKICDKEKED